MNLKDIQKEIERLEAEKETAIRSREGQGRGIPLNLLEGQQKKDAEIFDRQIAPLKLRKEHMIELRKWRFALISLVVGVAIGLLPKIFSESSKQPQDEKAELDALANTMYVHSDACAQEYEAGTRIANLLNDSYLQKQYLLQAGFMTEMDVMLSKEIWMDNCMWQKAIYNRYGLGIR